MRLDVVDEAAGGKQLGKRQQRSFLVHLCGVETKQTKNKATKTKNG